eukprot:RCo007396
MAHVKDLGRPPDLRILHFADSHSILSQARKEPAGGISRLATVVAQKRAEFGEQLLVLFSGDTFSPSLLSTLMRGQQVLPVFQALQVDAGMFGNHDFDFGVEELQQLAEGCGMPWVMTNLVDARTDRPIAGSLASVLLTVGRLKVGVMGIAEQEWLKTIRDLPSYVEYRDKFSCAQAEAQRLRQAGADLVIALTHQRESNDRDLLRRVPEIDLALGGHDHYPLHVVEAGTTLVKSGADCRSTSFVEVWKRHGAKPVVRVQLIELGSSVPEDPSVKAMMTSFEEQLSEKLSVPVCHLPESLDVFTATVRTRESSVGNLVADAMRKEMGADVGVLNSGVLRADMMYPGGSLLTVKDVLDILPIEDIVISIQLKGADIKAALESGFSRYPAHEGRFPLISGLTAVVVEASRPGQRVSEVKVDGVPLEDDRVYSVACTEYIFRGGDGYAALKACQAVLVDAENGGILPEIVQHALQNIPGQRHPQHGLPVLHASVDGRLVIRPYIPKLCFANLQSPPTEVAPPPLRRQTIPRSRTLANLMGKDPEDPTLARYDEPEEIPSWVRSPSRATLVIPRNLLPRRPSFGFIQAACESVQSSRINTGRSSVIPSSPLVLDTALIPLLSLEKAQKEDVETEPGCLTAKSISLPETRSPSYYQQLRDCIREDVAAEFDQLCALEPPRQDARSKVTTYRNQLRASACEVSVDDLSSGEITSPVPPVSVSPRCAIARSVVQSGPNDCSTSPESSSPKNKPPKLSIVARPRTKTAVGTTRLDSSRGGSSDPVLNSTRSPTIGPIAPVGPRLAPIAESFQPHSVSPNRMSPPFFSTASVTSRPGTPDRSRGSSSPAVTRMEVSQVTSFAQSCGSPGRSTAMSVSVVMVSGRPPTPELTRRCTPPSSSSPNIEIAQASERGGVKNPLRASLPAAPSSANTPDSGWMGMPFTSPTATALSPELSQPSPMGRSTRSQGGASMRSSTVGISARRSV